MDEVIKKLNEHDERFDRVDKKLNEHDERFDRVDKKLNEHDEQFDITARTLADHTERLDRIEDKMDGLATKEDISKVMSTLDTMVGFYKKDDEEIIVLAHNQKISNDRLDVAEKDIRRMKPLLGLS